MTRNASIAAGIAVLVVIGVFGPIASAEPYAAGVGWARGDHHGPEYMKFINVNGFQFDPLEGDPPLPDGLSYGKSVAGGVSYYIVQFVGPISSGMKDSLSEAGATILQYVNYNAFVVRADKDTVEQARTLPDVRWVGIFEPAYKLSPRLSEEYDPLIEDFLQRSRDVTGRNADVRISEEHDRMLASILGERQGPMAATPRRDAVSVEISVFEEWNLPLVLDSLSRLGIDFLTYSWQSSGLIRADLPRGLLTEVSHITGVMWIDRYVPRMLYNDVARWVVQSGDAVYHASPVHDHGINGSGQIVTVCDSGIDYEHDAFEDPSVSEPGPTHRKVTDYYVPEGAWGDGSDAGVNHGTHTSATVAGDDGVWHVYDGDFLGSNVTYGPHDGQAFGATLQVQDMSPDGYSVFPPPDFHTMYQEAMDRGSWIHTNSWGSWGGEYSTAAAQTDDFIWDNQDFLVIFAAGNDGEYSGALNPESTGKNLLAVGATLNGESMEHVAYFSSRGPAEDGRIKPDVMAPGVDIWSAMGGDPDGETDRYVMMSGTSMATPAVAGSCALIRQYYMDGWYPTGTAKEGNAFTPSAALVKATVINSAAEMTGDGAYAMSEYWYPNNSQGWGRVTLDDALYFQGDERGLLAYDERFGLLTGERNTYELAVGDVAIPLEITLVWSDYAGSPYSNPNLVNDLDLVVTAPDGTEYAGNQFFGYDPGESMKNPGESDRLNNVESVLAITDLQTGVWTVEVSAWNVPFGPQPYALVITGGISSDRGTISMDGTSYRSDASVILTISDVGLDVDPEGIDTAEALVLSSTELTPETIILTETGASTSVFRATVPLELSGSPIADDGVLQVQNGDEINASYHDEDDGFGGSCWVHDTATVDDDPPVISGVAVTGLRARTCKIVWSTDEPGNSTLWYGTETTLDQSLSSDIMSTSHVMSLSGILDNQTYYFAVGSSDKAGNGAVDDNGSLLYSFKTPVMPPSEPLDDEWPTFRNNLARLGTSPSDMTPPLECVWTRDVQAEVLLSSPVLSEGILVTQGTDGMLRAWDPYSGNSLWTEKVGERTSTIGTPTIDAGVVYTLGYSDTAGTTVVAVDLWTGETLWTRSSFVLGEWLSPLCNLACHDGRLFVCSEYSTFALDADDGSVLWEQNQEGSQMGVSVANGYVYMFQEPGGSFHALNESTGEIEWTRDVGVFASGPPCVTGDTVFLATEEGLLYALDAYSGEVVWCTGGLGYMYIGTPVCDGDTLYLSSFFGVIYAVDAHEGSVKWQTGTQEYETNMMAYANGYLYSATPYSGIVVYDASDGTLVDTYQLNEIVVSSPAVSDGWVWVQDISGTIYAFMGRVPTGLWLSPSFQTVGGTPGDTVRFDISVKNIGLLGADTFDIEMDGFEWDTELYAQDGETPLTDTDGDLVIDTGPVEPSGSAAIVALVAVPGDAISGDLSRATLTLTSSLDPASTRDCVITALVPLAGASVGPSVIVSVEPGSSETVTMEVFNDGGLTDTIEVMAESEGGWMVSVFAHDGTTVLTDSDGDGTPDVGALPGLTGVSVLVEVVVPADAERGSFDRVFVTARSSADPQAYGEAVITSTLPEEPSTDWPTLRHDMSRSGVSPVDLELPLTAEWAYSASSSYQMYSSPVISEGIVYIMASTGYLAALELTTGELIWSEQVGGTGYPPCTPTVDDGIIYVAAVDPYHRYMLNALDQFTGDEIWSYTAYTFGYGAYCSPVVSLGCVYWTDGFTGVVRANDALTGQLKWTHTPTYDYTARFGPSYFAGTLFVCGYYEGLKALDARTGEVHWQREDIAAYGAPAVVDSALYVADQDGEVYSLDPIDGTTIWRVDLGPAYVYASPLVADGRVFVGACGVYPDTDTMVAMNASDGEILWTEDVESDIIGSPAYVNSSVYAVASSGQVHAWAAATGTVLLDFNAIEDCYSSIAFSRGYMVVESQYGTVEAFAFNGTGVVASVATNPDPLALTVGQEGCVELLITDKFGNPVEVGEVEWDSVNGLGSIYPNTDDWDVITYVAGDVAGTDVLEYSCDVFSGTTTVNVLPGNASRVLIDPTSVVVGPGETFTFDAVVVDEYGNERSGAVIEWSASESAGTVDQEGRLVASVVAGTGTVTALSDGVSASATVTIVPGAVTSISTHPSSWTLMAGAHVIIEASAHDAFSNVVSGVRMNWSCDRGEVTPMGDDDSSAVFVAPTTPGAAQITVSGAGLESVVAITVTAGVLYSIVLAPDDIEMQTGEGVNITARWEDAYGNDLEEGPMEWSCTIGALEVSADGASVEFYSGDESGEGAVIASAGNRTGTASVTVAEAPGQSSWGYVAISLGMAAAVAAVATAMLLWRKRHSGPGQGPPPQQPQPPAT